MGGGSIIYQKQGSRWFWRWCSHGGSGGVTKSNGNRSGDGHGWLGKTRWWRGGGLPQMVNLKVGGVVVQSQALQLHMAVVVEVKKEQSTQTGRWCGGGRPKEMR